MTQLGIAAVRDEREAVAAEREVALVALHGGDDHALGQREERSSNVPRARPATRPCGRPRRACRAVAPAPSASSASTIAAGARLVGLDAAAAQRLGVRAARSATSTVAVREAVAERACRTGCRRVDRRLVVELRESQRTGRAKRSPPPSQRIDFANASPSDERGEPLGSGSPGRPDRRPRGGRRARSSRPPRRRACARSPPRLRRRSSTGGPLTHSSGVALAAGRR